MLVTSKYDSYWDHGNCSRAIAKFQKVRKGLSLESPHLYKRGLAPESDPLRPTGFQVLCSLLGEKLLEKHQPWNLPASLPGARTSTQCCSPTSSPTLSGGGRVSELWGGAGRGCCCFSRGNECPGFSDEWPPGKWGFSSLFTLGSPLLAQSPGSCCQPLGGGSIPLSMTPRRDSAAPQASGQGWEGTQ